MISVLWAAAKHSIVKQAELWFNFLFLLFYICDFRTLIVLRRSGYILLPNSLMHRAWLWLLLALSTHIHLFSGLRNFLHCLFILLLRRNHLWIIIQFLLLVIFIVGHLVSWCSRFGLVPLCVNISLSRLAIFSHFLLLLKLSLIFFILFVVCWQFHLFKLLS